MHQITYRDHTFLVAPGQVFDPAVADVRIEGLARAPTGDILANSLTMGQCERLVAETAHYPGAGQQQLIYPLVGLMGEAGEVADVLLRLLLKQPEALAGLDDLDTATCTLEVMGRFGALLEVIKKAFRNDPPGELTGVRRQAIELAIEYVERPLRRLRVVMQNSSRVVFPPVDSEEDSGLVKELGDVGYYWFRTCTEAGLAPGTVALTNYAKLRDRASRGVLRSTGDDR